MLRATSSRLLKVGGLDQDSWARLGPAHAQAALKQVLTRFDSGIPINIPRGMPKLFGAWNSVLRGIVFTVI